MIINKDKFVIETKISKANLAALPQANDTWCLAVKVGGNTSYLGKGNEEQAEEFDSLDKLINSAQNMGVAEVLVITGTASWTF